MSGKDDRRDGARPAPNRVCVGKFGAPHGVKGEIRIKSYTGEPLAIAGYGALTDSRGERSFRILEARLLKSDMLVARIMGISDRDSSETLTNLDIYVDRRQLPEPEEDEFYLSDLIGLEARLESGIRYGQVTNVLNFGAGDILEIAREGGGQELVIFNRINVPKVDVAAGFAVVAPPPVIDDDADPDRIRNE